MIQNTELTAGRIPSETLVRAVWAFATGGVVIAFLFLSWLSIQRAEILIARHEQREAEARLVAAQKEDAEAMRGLNERLSKSEAARFAAEREAQEIASNGGKRLTHSQFPSNTSIAPAKAVPMQTEVAGPSGQDLTNFIKAHLSHMMVSVDVSDYAEEEVDFHDKPHASVRAIENDRRQWAQKYPVRSIAVNEIQPQLSAVQDATYGWIATATFNWRWEFKTRSGGVVRGLTRDTWKIAPSPQGLKIISEHSADPMTGQSKD